MPPRPGSAELGNSVSMPGGSSALASASSAAVELHAPASAS
ncbi:MAG: hypothetical protein U0168_03365 [Nannocystaceae bacterium]